MEIKLNDDSQLAEDGYTECWACGCKVLKPRIESHHILGRKISDAVIPLCVLCHDLVDRIPMSSEQHLEQYLVNCYSDLIKMGNEFKWTKIFILKLFSMSFDISRQYTTLNMQQTNKSVIGENNELAH